MNIGAALCVLFAVTFAIGGSVAILRMPFGSYVLGSVGGSGVVVVLRLFLAGGLQSAAVACATLALRRYLRLGGGFGFDMLAAGASLVPIGVASLAAALVGFANFGLALGIVMSGAAYSVLILYSALAHLCCVPQKWLAPSVAIVIVVGAWIFKTAIFAFLM